MLSFEPGSVALLQALAGASLRALVLAGIAGLAIWWWRGRTAPIQHAVWTVVAVAMLLFLWSPVPVSLVPEPAPAAFVGPEGIRVHREPLVIGIDSRGGMWADAVGPCITRGWWSWGAALYLAGVAMMLGRLAVGSFLAGRLVGRSARVREERVTAALEAVAREQEAPMPWPEVLESEELTAPVVVGRHASAILLPAGWREWDDWKLRAVLAHELAHVRRSDVRTVVLAAWNRAVFWFHPLAWWMERRLSALSEQACDDAAVRTMGDAPRYAQVLWEIAAAGSGRRVAWAISMAGASPMGLRIDRLLTAGAGTSGLAPRRAWVGIALATLPVVMLLATAQPPGPMADSRDVRPGWNWPEDGYRTTAEQAREPEALGARARLIAHYCYNADFERAGAHVFWVIENRPESELAGAVPTMGVSFSELGAPGETERVGERARQLWKEQAGRHSGNVRVLGHAAAALHWAEPAEAERLLLRARELDGGDDRWVGRLAALYAELITAQVYEQAGLGERGGRMRRHREMGERVRRQLAVGTDDELAGRVGAALAGRLVHSRAWKGEKEKELRLALRTLGECAEELLARAAAKDEARWGQTLAELRAWLVSQRETACWHSQERVSDVVV